jgi:hypothetical protein
MLKRGIQLLTLAILVSLNWQFDVQADACEENGPQWCCTRIVCPTHQDLCALQGGTGPCSWDGSNCNMLPCIQP